MPSNRDASEIDRSWLCRLLSSMANAWNFFEQQSNASNKESTRDLVHN